MSLSSANHADNTFELAGRVIEAACEAAELERDDILGDSRMPRHSWPRFVAMEIVRARTGLSWSAIAPLFNKTAHTSIRAGAGRAEQMRASEPALEALSAQIEAIVDRRRFGPCQDWLAKLRAHDHGDIAWRPDVAERNVRRRSRRAPAEAIERCPDDSLVLSESMVRVLRAVIRHPCATYPELAKAARVNFGVLGRAVEALVQAEFLDRDFGRLRVLRFPNGHPVPRPSAADQELIAAFLAEKGATRCPVAVLDSGQGYRSKGRIRATAV